MDFYQFAKTVVFNVLKPIYRMEVIGKENFPAEGGILLCSNHIDNLDPPMVGICSPRPVNFMAKEELFKVPILKSILPKVHAFPVKRGLSDRQALRVAIDTLKDGQVVGLFPEGTRNKSGKLGKGFSGAGFFALRGNANVVPCAIIGPYKPFRKVKVVFGKPIDMEPYRETKAKAEEVTQVIMDHIQLLLNEHHPENK
ncbi:1-acyl-sn-glycerol-3-phosphate acyltransferase [Rummeliibacillus sp. G93]|uniref:Acyl-phosphate glycerol 3-phosphate acyltransferase n=1 Tax=Rummeliibacillus stabekisii TaxID=241244 RepID=A0A143HA83_9BACL|nr:MULTISPECIES: lysophospholipid acyltransferase family protein [Rummeliibacillus]AMW98628.1 acyl-phosphate glycerol 3-phosphate acyltransferase [Rummeliibacillus stabekisii]MBB5169733.1 1-acyl-sn-glycerol-3-phosphate acyltransferase [Rummeliibacillus stabekisii]UQW98521.1 1-acyl-sn-glycerol-3-phosphate acyltransferase [Rummeliibacillus sp. G93]GEL03990.1 1-acyl-sn-glycerol-3-phosphate acyltransferase [Rummeliibacillus stabekisii]